MNIIQRVFLCMLPVYLFSWSWSDWFASPKEKVDFMCPHHCGEWGSETIRSVEWQFVQCLYDAYKLHNFAEKNFLSCAEYPSTFSLLFLLSYQDLKISNQIGISTIF